MTKEFLHKIKRKLMKMRLQPIRVFCLHHVCAEFDPESMNACDWMQIDDFKAKVQALQQDGVEFISLTEAYKHICDNWIRCKKYAVLTFDDGYASLKEILPWLNEQHIPATLFINGKYLDGKSYRNNPKEKYLTQEDLKSLNIQYPLLSIGSHGWEHVDATKQTEQEFSESISNSVNVLRSYPNFIPFFAFTWGYCNSKTYNTVCASNLIPVFMNGNKNFNNKASIYRELLK